jgi:hypothetical protein
MIYNPYFEKYSIDAVVVPMGCKAEDYAAFSSSCSSFPISMVRLSPCRTR